MPGEWEREPVSEASSDSRADSSSQETSDIDASGAGRRYTNLLTEKTQPSKYYQIWRGNNQIWAKIINFQDAFKSQPAANKLKLVAFPNQVQNLILKQVLLAGHGNAFPYSESEN